MFGLFKKDPTKKLEREYEQLMEKAMHVQRSGDLKAYAVLIEKAEAIQQQLEEIQKEQA